MIPQKQTPSCIPWVPKISFFERGGERKYEEETNTFFLFLEYSFTSSLEQK